VERIDEIKMEITVIIILLCLVSMLGVYVVLYVKEFRKNLKLNRQIKQQKYNNERIIFKLDNFIEYLSDKQISELLGSIRVIDKLNSIKSAVSMKVFK